MKKYILVVGLSALLLAGCGAKNTESESATQEGSVLASCLTDNGWKMFGTETCKYCKKQKELFANNFDNINYINCRTNAEECQKAGIQGYPTWQSPDGSLHPGLQDLEKLQQLSACETESGEEENEEV